MDNTVEIMRTVFSSVCVASFLLNTKRAPQSIELCQECLILLNHTAQGNEPGFAYTAIYVVMYRAYRLLNDHTSAIECGRILLDIPRGLGFRAQESKITFQLAKLCQLQSKYKEAKELYKKSLSIMIETGDRKGEVLCYGNLGSVYQSVSEYGKAKEYQKKALAITKEIDDKKEEAMCYVKLGIVYFFLDEYAKAEEYLNRALTMNREIGDKQVEADCYGNLGILYLSLGDYAKAEEYQKKALAIRKEIGDKRGEAACYGNLGRVSESFGEYRKAEEYLKKAVAITKEIGDKQVEAACYGNLGRVSQSVSEYAKAEEYQKKALAIRKEIGYKQGEAECHGNLGTVYLSLGQYAKAEQYLNYAVAIMGEIGDKQGEATCYGNLGNVYLSLGQYTKAKQYLNNALAIKRQIGDKQGEAACYGNLGNVFESLGEYGKAEEYERKALAISQEIGDKEVEAVCYGNLGTLFCSLGRHTEAKQYHEKALAMSSEISVISEEVKLHLEIACDVVLEGREGSRHEIFSNLFASIDKCEKMRRFLGPNDQFKISLLEKHITSYKMLSVLLCLNRNEENAVCILELGRARALADLMTGQYSAQQQLLVNPPSWADIERILEKESNCSCLYISYVVQCMILWVLKGNKPLLLRTMDVNKCFESKGLERTVDQIFSQESFRKFTVLPQEHCEDRSLFCLKASDSTSELSERENLAAYRPVEEEEEENLEPVPTLEERYTMIIAPVADLLNQPELVIVPDRVLYKVPFAALKDESGKYLSDTYKIRIVPSLTTLGLIQDSPADYHSRTGALIVGEPDVRDVYYKGCLGILSRLPSAKEEAEMIGALIGAEPLLGKEATKKAVLQSIHSVSLIHFAAHGDAERGEIALAPEYSINGTPTEKDYLLTMDDISQVQLRAKLVVLSCCHSARGHVKAEGVVGIARAFLGSGARSVLVALWAVPDKATKELMSRFYEHLVRGESASESLHQAMKWMRNNGYSDVRDWAPFMLIGDNVRFDFGK